MSGLPFLEMLGASLTLRPVVAFVELGQRICCGLPHIMRERHVGDVYYKGAEFEQTP
jgi:hypothetical protein